MPLALEHLPVSASLDADHTPAGPLSSRPYGLDAVTGAKPYDPARLAVATLCPDTQLSMVDGRLIVDCPELGVTSSNTESDGNSAIAVDHDESDDVK
ncbi:MULTISPECIES: hypothetical protein [unclassified Streptomyces]|uniref:hypothetical protein n=1 Tax=unclassified Streptomyces TaxID=2593676 RepID=UPI000CD568D1|nr:MULTISPECIES: hypothetical protein [unclassified Streptomyces]